MLEKSSFQDGSALQRSGDCIVVRGPGAASSTRSASSRVIACASTSCGRDIPIARAWEYVAGFIIVNDFSARDLQRAEIEIGLGPAKGKDFATAVGPMLVTRDEVSERINGEKISLEMRARVNGRELSKGNSSALHHSFPRMIAQASRDADLFPGDLIGSGTVGSGCILELGPENTGGWLKPGDTVELEIEKLGVLRTRVVPRSG